MSEDNVHHLNVTPKPSETGESEVQRTIQRFNNETLQEGKPEFVLTLVYVEEDTAPRICWGGSASPARVIGDLEITKQMFVADVFDSGE